MNKSAIMKQTIFLVILTIGFVIINKYCQLLAIPCKNDIRGISYDFFSINSIMIGFSFTALGMLLSFNSRAYVEKLKGTNIVVNKARKIIWTMTLLGISGGLNLVIVFARYGWWVDYIYVTSFVFMVFGFIYFINSMYCVYDLIRKIHTFDKQGGMSKAEQGRKPMISHEEKDTW